jgi:hypothetical protein
MYAQVGTFIQALRGQQGVAALALEFCILTATRTFETIGAVGRNRPGRVDDTCRPD